MSNKIVTQEGLEYFKQGLAGETVGDTANHNEVFNDYENNVAGTKGFLISNIEKVTDDGLTYYNEKIEVKITLNSTEGLEVNDVISLRYYADVGYLQYSGNIATISSINEKVVTVVIAEGKKTSHLFQKVNNPTDKQKSYLWVINKPLIGDSTWFHSAHAEGILTKAIGNGAHAEGSETIASGQYAHAEGNETYAEYACHAEGKLTKATGEQSHAEGYMTEARGGHAEGIQTKSLGRATHAEGESTVASGRTAHAEGIDSHATGDYSHAEGFITTASGEGAHSEGGYWYDEGEDVTTRTCASGKFSHAEGAGSQATEEGAHAEGRGVANGKNSHAEGFGIAGNTYSHAEGNGIAEAAYAHAEGQDTKAQGTATHAEGINTIAEGRGSHAEGEGSHANSGSGWHDTAAHAEGIATKAYAKAAHTEGILTEAHKEAAHAEGIGTIANFNHQHVQGKYNIAGDYAHIVGGGSSKDERENIHTIDWNGNAWFAGGVTINKDTYFGLFNPNLTFSTLTNYCITESYILEKNYNASTAKTKCIYLNGNTLQASLFIYQRTDGVSTIGDRSWNVVASNYSIQNTDIKNGNIVNLSLYNCNIHNCVIMIDTDQDISVEYNQIGAFFNQCEIENSRIVIKTSIKPIKKIERIYGEEATLDWTDELTQAILTDSTVQNSEIIIISEYDGYSNDAQNPWIKTTYLCKGNRSFKNVKIKQFRDGLMGLLAGWKNTSTSTELSEPETQVAGSVCSWVEIEDFRTNQSPKKTETYIRS